jgi:nucleoside-diphosphate-sugar epimerase
MARIFLAGATGTLGRPISRALVEAGDAVFGTTRSQGRASIVTEAGGTPVVVDALDADALTRAAVEARPDVVIHMLTALPAPGPVKASDLAATNRLREDGTRNLLRAAVAAGAKRLVAESFVAAAGQPGPASASLQSLERQLSDARGEIETVALRFGSLYGPDVPATRALLHQLRRHRMFVPGGPQGIMSFVHLDDAVSATLAAVRCPSPGPLYGVADDEPMSIPDFVRVLASAMAVPPPRTMPRWIVRLVAPFVAGFTEGRFVVDHAALTRDTGWRPRYPSAREGARDVAARASGRKPGA